MNLFTRKYFAPRMGYRIYGLLFVLWLLTWPSWVIANAPLLVGHVSFAKGSNAAQQPESAPRILGKDSEIFQGDNIQTSESSFVIVEFTDGSKVTVRPNSNFSIDHYDNQSANKTAQLVLYQGGVNTSTGNIAKDNPDNFQIKTATATVKPKSEKAELAVQICDKECEDRAKKAASETNRTEQSVVARIVEIRGEVVAFNRGQVNGNERTLALGSPLYNADSLRSEKESYALLLFPDGEKLTVQADTEFDIKQYHYQISGKKDQILLRLATGGLRALTGSIGKNDHTAFAMDTPVATIGIRGTGTDSYTDGNSLQHSTWQGTSFIHNSAGEFDVPEGNSSTTSGPNSIPIVFPTPVNAVQPVEPRPDTNKSDPKKVFEEKTATQGDTIVKAKSGEATVETKGGDKDTVKEGKTSTSGSSGEIKFLATPLDDDSNDNNSPGGHLFDDDHPGGANPDDNPDGC